MTRIWKIVLTAALVVLVCGIVLAAAGWLTGASPNRMAEVLFGGWDGARDAANALWAELTALLRF